MANAGPNTNGSQFFIVLDDLRGKLPKNYTIFGRVTAGMDVVDAIASTPTRTGRSGENSSPTEPVTLEKVTISTNPEYGARLHAVFGNKTAGMVRRHQPGRF